MVLFELVLMLWQLRGKLISVLFLIWNMSCGSCRRICQSVHNEPVSTATTALSKSLMHILFAYVSTHPYHHSTDTMPNGIFYS